jgi:hypothetical protein
MSDETKRCPTCERELPTEQFNRRANGRCYAYCKACQSVYARNHYVKDPAAYKRRSFESNRRYRLRNRDYIIGYLRAHPCVDCGETDPVVLDFDHMGKKEFEVSDLVRCAFGLDRIKTEIERCEVRCARCHRRRTAEQFSWKIGLA